MADWISESLNPLFHVFSIGRIRRSASTPTTQTIVTKNTALRLKVQDGIWALKLDNVRDHRAGTEILQAEKIARKPGLWSFRVVFCCLLREPVTKLGASRRQSKSDAAKLQIL